MGPVSATRRVAQFAATPRDLKGRRISHLRLGARNVIKTIRRGANASAGRAVRAALPIGRVSPRLFREATQLKTVATVTHITGIEHPRFRSQIPHRDVARHRCIRPAVPVAADVAQRARSCRAEARGGARAKNEAGRNPMDSSRPSMQKRVGKFDYNNSLTAPSIPVEATLRRTMFPSRSIRKFAGIFWTL